MKLANSNAFGVNPLIKLNIPEPIILNILNAAPAAGCTLANILNKANITTNITIAVKALKKNFLSPQKTAFKPNIPPILSMVACFSSESLATSLALSVICQSWSSY